MISINVIIEEESFLRHAFSLSFDEKFTKKQTKSKKAREVANYGTYTDEWMIHFLWKQLEIDQCQAKYEQKVLVRSGEIGHHHLDWWAFLS